MSHSSARASLYYNDAMDVQKPACLACACACHVCNAMGTSSTHNSGLISQLHLSSRNVPAHGRNALLACQHIQRRSRRTHNTRPRSDDRNRNDIASLRHPQRSSARYQHRRLQNVRELRTESWRFAREGWDWPRAACVRAGAVGHVCRQSGSGARRCLRDHLHRTELPGFQTDCYRALAKSYPWQALCPYSWYPLTF
jgi:hypothetical protein